MLKMELCRHEILRKIKSECCGDFLKQKKTPSKIVFACFFCFYLLLFFPLFSFLRFLFFVFVCFCFCWTLVHSISPFWIFSLMLTCLFIFWEFESAKFEHIDYFMDDLNVIVGNGITQQDIESRGHYRRAKVWWKFESRKGCRVMSYVGFFGVFWGEIFRIFSRPKISIFSFLKFHAETRSCLRIAP